MYLAALKIPYTFSVRNSFASRFDVVLTRCTSCNSLGLARGHVVHAGYHTAHNFFQEKNKTHSGLVTLTHTIIIIIIIWLYSSIRALASPLKMGFVIITFLRGWIVSPAPNPQPGGPGLRIYDPRRQCGPAIPPGTGYPFQSSFTTCMAYSGTILFNHGHHTGN
jgi:hypothetical protein